MASVPATVDEIDALNIPASSHAGVDQPQSISKADKSSLTYLRTETTSVSGKTAASTTHDDAEDDFDLAGVGASNYDEDLEKGSRVTKSQPIHSGSVPAGKECFEAMDEKGDRTTVEQKAIALDDFPDGGLRAWSVVVGVSHFFSYFAWILLADTDSLSYQCSLYV